MTILQMCSNFWHADMKQEVKRECQELKLGQQYVIQECKELKQECKELKKEQWDLQQKYLYLEKEHRGLEVKFKTVTTSLERAQVDIVRFEVQQILEKFSGRYLRGLFSFKLG